MDIKELIKQIEELVRENEELKRQNKELREQLNSSDEHEPRYFVASSISIHKKFHKPSCPWAAKISPSNLREFSSHQEAEYADYKPCQTCRA